MDSNNFDTRFKKAIEKSTAPVTPSKDIFEEAWQNRNKNDYSKSGTFRLKKLSLAAVCFLIVISTAFMFFSPAARTWAATVYQNIKSVFIVEKSEKGYKIVEKPENETVIDFNVGGISINEDNKEDFEKLLGFKFFMPEKIGEYFMSGGTSVGLQVKSMKVHDIKKMRDSFFNAIDDEKEYKSLGKYDAKRFVTAVYTDANGQKYYFYIEKKASADTNDKIIKKGLIGDIKYEYIETPRAQYEKVVDRQWSNDGSTKTTSSFLIYDDLTKKPSGILVSHFVTWELSGIEYSLTSDKDLDMDTGLKFAREYLKLTK